MSASKGKLAGGAPAPSAAGDGTAGPPASPGKLRVKELSQYHVAVAAEAFAAGLFARAKCDVSVQYGANQPGYDLVVAKGDRLMRVSVKGSQDGGWGLVQSYKKGVDYAGAVDLWAKRHGPTIVLCFVQFWQVAPTACPRVYLATVPEVAAVLKTSRHGCGNTILYEHYAYKKGAGLGCVDKLPAAWVFSASRVDELLAIVATG